MLENHLQPRGSQPVERSADIFTIFLRSYRDMRVDAEFMVPAYYPHFVCKGGACRHTCCEGLEVNMTEAEYFRLLTLECTPELRRQLDAGIRVNGYPDENRYARLLPNFLGTCHLLDAQGLCMLQRECGADMLTAVCRYYPRSPQIADSPACATANACEETLELLFAMAERGESWSCLEQELSFDLPGDRLAGGSQAEKRTGLRRELLQVLAEPSEPIQTRLWKLQERIRNFSRGKAQGHVPFVPDRPASAWPVSLVALRRFAVWCGGKYPDMKPYMDAVRRLLDAHSGSDDLDREVEARLQRLQEQQSWFPLFLSLVLANDFFYRHIPFAAESCSMEQQAAAFAGMTELLLLMTTAMSGVGKAEHLCAAGSREEDNFSAADGTTDDVAGRDGQNRILIDGYAAFFRMVELTDFDRNLLASMEDSGSDQAG